MKSVGVNDGLDLGGKEGGGGQRELRCFWHVHCTPGPMLGNVNRTGLVGELMRLVSDILS